MSVSDNPMMEFALSYPVDVRSIPPKGFDVILKTDAGERCKLAENHALAAVEEFSAHFHIRPWKKQGIRIQGEIKALIVQKCVITAEPVKNVIDHTVDVIYAVQDSQLMKFPEAENTRELVLDVSGPDAPEIFEGKEIDVGAVAEEFFELAIDPYPRKAGASFTAQSGGAEADALPSAFAVLSRLKKT